MPTPVVDGLHSFVSHQPTQSSAASRHLGVNAAAICWHQRAVRNGEGETEAARTAEAGRLWANE